MANRKANGKKVSQESSILTKLKDMTKNDTKAYYILWKYAPEFMPDRGIKTFEQLKENYKCFESDVYTREHCESWMIEKNVQGAVKYLLGRLNQLRMFELYQKFYEKAAGGDIKAFEAIIKFSDGFFQSSDESELSKILRAVKIDDLDENEE